MDCEIVRVDQHSDDWFALRRGRITASRVADVVARPDTLRYQKYQREIVLELLGHEFVEEEGHWFEHGREQELTIVSYANGLYLSVQAQKRLAAEGVKSRVIDLHWLSPLPEEALLVSAGGHAVDVVVASKISSKVARQAVSLGGRGDGRVEVVDGLDEGMRVVVGGVAFLTAGARVVETQDEGSP